MTSSSQQALVALALGLASSLSVGPARSAPEISPSELTVARRLFEEGKAAEDAGEFRLAAEKFRRAASIKDTPGIRFHLARCEEEQGAFVEALLEYDRARELLDSGVKAADVAKLLPAARERAQAKIAQLKIKVPSEVRDVTVELDGKPLSVSVLGVSMPINPGKHRVTASAVGHANYARELELQSGEGVELAVELPPVAKTPTPTPTPIKVAAGAPASHGSVAPRPADSSVQPRTIVLVSEATLVVAGLTTGVIFSVLRSAAEDRYNTATQAVLAEVGGSDPDGVACSGELAPPPCADLKQAGQDRTRDANIATASFVAAGVSAAAFGLTYWLWPERTPAASARAVVVPGGAALSLAGRF
jgi:hypothetical protein